MAGYFYLNRQSTQKVQNEVSSVPYYSYTPENCGLLISIGTDKLLVYMDFEDTVITVISADEIDREAQEIYGYSIDYKLECQYDVVERIVDVAGGIELELEGELLNCTGVQVVEILSNNADENFKNEVTRKIIENLSENDFKKEDILYIIEHSRTNLTVPDCYFWDEYIKDLCKNARFIN